MLDLDVVYDKLEQFETADEIARFLQDQEIKAAPKLAATCAIAVWVKKATETELVIHVATSKTVIYHSNAKKMRTEGKSIEDTIIWQRDHTEAMQDFISRFDAGDYPNLLQRPYELYGSDHPICKGTEVAHTAYAKVYSSSYNTTFSGSYSLIINASHTEGGIKTITDISMA